MSGAELPVWRQAAVILLLATGVLGSTVGVAGMARLPGLYARIHAAGKGVVLGVVAILAAGLFLDDGGVAARCLVVAGFALLTMPLASHVLARAHHQEEKGSSSPPRESR